MVPAVKRRGGRVLQVVRRAIRPAAVVVIAFFAGAYLFRNAGTLADSGLRLEPGALGIALLCALVYWLLLAVLWWQVQAPLGGGLSLAAAVRVWSLSTVARYVPGNIWHLAGRTALARDAGGDPAAALTASIYEQVLTVAGAFLAAGVLPLAGGDGVFLLTVLALPAALIVLHPAVQRLLLGRAAKLLGRQPPMVLTTRRQVRLLLLYALPNIPAGLALFALGWPSGPPAPASIGAFGFAWAAGYLSFLTPSGLGVREVAMTAALTNLPGAEQAAVLAIGHRVVLTVAELLLAAALGAAGKVLARVL